MPTTSRDARLVLSRRGALGLVAGTALVAGCTPKGVDRRAKPTPSALPTPEEDPDVALAARVLTAEQGLLDRVAATVRRHPGLRARLSAAEAAHRAHVRLLTEAVPDKARTPTPTPIPRPTPTPTPTPTVTATPTPGTSPTGSTTPAPAATAPTSTAPPTPAVPRRPGPALALLAREEGRLSVVDKRSSFAAESGAFARVLASMAASAAQHAAVLTAAAAREDR